MRVMRVREKICLGKITFVLSSFSKIYNFCLGKIKQNGTKFYTFASACVSTSYNFA